ncbi:ABC transporter permease [Fodinicola feengrottensis]|uniref:ABC transporter permease n=1 Tax=Fodinicola feengrottensis TaxID=435914 RepID=UPI002442C39A|nr:ABC transporter permease [Fodinicola feengrottensis]
MSTFAPAPGRAPMSRILLAQSAMELKLTLRRGESLLLTLVIPILVLLGIGLTSVVRLPTADRMGFVVPGVMGLAVMSTAFTGQAIATGFERSYGVLKRLGASALPRWGLMVAKTVGVIAVIVLQVAVLAVVGLLAGWHPSAAGILPALGLAVVGTAAFSGLGLWMAGTLRAEATLAAAQPRLFVDAGRRRRRDRRTVFRGWHSWTAPPGRADYRDAGGFDRWHGAIAVVASVAFLGRGLDLRRRPFFQVGMRGPVLSWADAPA